MSVDDAFRKLMKDHAFDQSVISGGAEQPEDPAARVATAVVEHPEPVLETRVSEAAPDAAAPEPDVEKLDISRITHVRRFAHHPIDPRSQIAEEYRILRTRVQALELPRPSILLTSCHHNEGKTSTALNLSLTMAKKRGAKILLVDFDLRRPRLHKLLGLPKKENDVVSALRGKCDVEDVIQYSEEDNLYVLCAKREYSNGTDFLETKHAREIIERLHATFDFVVMDSCPCLSTSDPAVLGPYVGGVIMVIRCLQTQRESIEHAVSSLNDLGVPVIGVLLTFMKYFIPRYLYRYQYYHGYYYYKGYGYGGGSSSSDDDEDMEPVAQPVEGDMANDPDDYAGIV